MALSIGDRIRRWVVGGRLARLDHKLRGAPAWLDPVRLNLKSYGYDLARSLAPGLARVDASGEPRPHGLGWRATTQADVESAWFAHWCHELRIAPIYHRKIWEYAYVLQVLWEAGMLRPGLRGIGFGCGEEPLPSYLASKDLQVTVTDLDPERSRGTGWMETGQHASTLGKVHKPELVDRERFSRLVGLEYVDMNHIPPGLDGKHDFCWSICAMEHLGSIEAGLAFVEGSLRTLKPGGVAVHTAEFNYLSDTVTLETGVTVLYLRRHFEALRERLVAAGHVVGAVDYATGEGPMDRFIDLPPFPHQLGPDAGWMATGHHLKLTVQEFPSTCFGMVVRRAG